MRLVLLVLLVLLVVGVMPTFPYSRTWGWAPSGGISALVVVLIVLALMGGL
jgi:hypothetical protein